MSTTSTKQFRPPFWQFNGHVQTIYPSLFRKVSVDYHRERIEIPDGDFLDLDWAYASRNQAKKSKKLMVVTHGLEGDSTRHYVTGMVKKFTDNGYDGLGWNCRSCGGEINRLPRFYHHGDADDLRYVVDYAIKEFGYEEVVVVGYSMGGSLTLRFLGEKPELVPPQVKAGIAASVPLDLPTSVIELYKRGKRFYMKRFIDKLGVKIEKKSRMYPENELLSVEGYDEIKNFHQFDGRYTAPLHGFAGADQFYEFASAKPLLKNIERPTLIVQALNDPFLSPPCFDLGEAKTNKNLKLEITEKGGHVGFIQAGSKENFVEKRAWEFVN